MGDIGSELSSTMLLWKKDVKPPIPRNESERLKLLRESKLLKSSPRSDAAFDRFTSLSRRLLNAPIALITFVDEHEHVFKSTSGEFQAKDMKRDDFFCTYTILPDQPDVFVVEDASKDDRFKDLKVVTDEPKIRFYAGAAIMLDHVKIGSLSVLDTAPRTSTQFTTVDRMNLLDLGAAVSILVKDRRDAAMKSAKECASILAGAMHDMRRPLNSISLATRGVMDGLEGIKKFMGIKETLKGESKVIDAIQYASGHLKVVLESCTSLGQFMMDKTDCENPSERLPTYIVCNLTKTIKEVRLAIKRMKRPDANVTWDIDHHSFNKSDRNICSPKVVHFMLLNAAEHLATVWDRVDIKIFFKGSTNDSMDEDLFTLFDRLPAVDIEGDWQQGRFVAEFCVRNKRSVVYDSDDDMDSDQSTDDEGEFDEDDDSYYAETPGHRYQILRQSLKYVQGTCTLRKARCSMKRSRKYSKNPTGGYEQILKCELPCAVFLRTPVASKRPSIDVYGKEFPKNQSSSAATSADVIRALEEGVQKFAQLSGSHLTDGTSDDVKKTNKSEFSPVLSPTLSPALTPAPVVSPCSTPRRPKTGSMLALPAQEGAITSPRKAEHQGPGQSSTKSSTKLPPVGNSSKTPHCTPRTILHAPLSTRTEEKMGLRSDLERSNHSDVEGSAVAAVEGGTKEKASTAEAAEAVQPVKKLGEVRQPSQRMGRMFSIRKEPDAAPLGLRVLICEDSIAAQKTVCKWLEKHGCITTVAHNGKEGLQYMTTQEFDVCLMDFLMPVMNGIDAISGFKNWALEVTGGRCDIDGTDYLNKDMLIVGMSANMLNDDMAGAFMKGMHYFLPKPIVKDQLMAILSVKKSHPPLDEARDRLDGISVGSSETSRKDRRKKKPSFLWDPNWMLLNPAALLGKVTGAQQDSSGGASAEEQHRGE